MIAKNISDHKEITLKSTVKGPELTKSLPIGQPNESDQSMREVYFYARRQSSITDSVLRREKQPKTERIKFSQLKFHIKSTILPNL
ncbi:hypothetical protein GJ496_009648 [Pomphorhynchus laevis]|nr:hypothetical protein GJ496_009648 [Pomphorhynchus laevis]